jgi:hypothetical protein
MSPYTDLVIPSELRCILMKRGQGPIFSPVTLPLLQSLAMFLDLRCCAQSTAHETTPPSSPSAENVRIQVPERFACRQVRRDHLSISHIVISYEQVTKYLLQVHFSD